MRTWLMHAGFPIHGDVDRFISAGEASDRAVNQPQQQTKGREG